MKRILSFICAAAMISTALLCGCGSQNSSSQASPEQSSEAAPTTVQPVTDSPVKATGGKIHINDNTLGDIWITELEGVPVNKLSDDGFTADASFKYYSEDGKAASQEGVDISSFCGDIDWARVKEAGVDFAMVRIGGRSYGDKGDLYADDRALSYKEEAEYAHSILGDTKLDYPLAYDWEIIKDDSARTDSVTATQATECAVAFCEKARSLGYTPMVYSASREFYFKYDLTRLKDYELWLAQYADLPGFYYRFSMWQYSDQGKVDGIEGTVDLNVCFTGVASYAQ